MPIQIIEERNKVNLHDELDKWDSASRVMTAQPLVDASFNVIGFGFEIIDSKYGVLRYDTTKEEAREFCQRVLEEIDKL